ncbi:MAG TPA: hypothetical protein VK871_14760 [Candidatus Limnocylindrales bacterium]|nr:hypothetical protein [Candidatus Limnocylindrales bacterium]
MRAPQRFLPGLVFVAAIVAGCGWQFFGVGASPIAGPLVTVETRGGECPAGACGQTTVIERDGRVHLIAPAAAELGTVDPTLLEALRVEIEQADFAAIAGRPFTGECPTAYDGQETIFTFETSTGSHRLASCEVAIDLDATLFRAALAAIGSVR